MKLINIIKSAENFEKKSSILNAFLPMYQVNTS